MSLAQTEDSMGIPNENNIDKLKTKSTAPKSLQLTISCDSLLDDSQSGSGNASPNGQQPPSSSSSRFTSDSNLEDSVLETTDDSPTNCRCSLADEIWEAESAATNAAANSIKTIGLQHPFPSSSLYLPTLLAHTCAKDVEASSECQKSASSRQYKALSASSHNLYQHNHHTASNLTEDDLSCHASHSDWYPDGASCRIEDEGLCQDILPTSDFEDTFEDRDESRPFVGSQPDEEFTEQNEGEDPLHRSRRFRRKIKRSSRNMANIMRKSEARPKPNQAKQEEREEEEGENKLPRDLRESYLKAERENRKKKRKSSHRKKSGNLNDEERRLYDLESSESFMHSYSSLSDLTLSRSTIDLNSEENCCYVWKGMLLAIISGVLFTVNNFVLVHAGLNPMDAVLVRAVVHITILGLYYGGDIWCDKVGYVILQGIFGAISLAFALYSVTLMPIPDALTLLFTAPLPTFILSVIFFKEKVTAMKGTAMLMVLGGVVLVCKPSFLFPNKDAEIFNADFYLGVTLATLSAILGSLMSCLSSYCKGSPFGVLVFWVATAALAVALVGEYVMPGCLILTLRGSLLSNFQWGCLFGMSISGMVAYLSLAKSLQMVSPTLVSSLRSLEIILSFGIQAVIDSALPDPVRGSGAAMVCIGICLSAFQGWLDRPRDGYQSLD